MTYDVGTEEEEGGGGGGEESCLGGWGCEGAAKCSLGSTKQCFTALDLW